ncbi:protein TolQ [Desulfosoma caldarium]|uniref:Cell division and transport-associated protein TolQ n=1 Tax=Desulfosoma caldarium TaxID=610254 RepID=A0A3N1VHW9_9BACT|nr:protein TolQ [Desulfosoma caldarium]ROR01490.1 cell division and transport-associated protein TolQ [Desulfosoma caldarium]
MVVTTVFSPMLVTVALAAPKAGVSNGVADMIWNAGPMVKLVLLTLVIMSLACWGVVLVKFKVFRRAERQSEDFYELYRKKKNFGLLYRESQALSDSYLAQVFRAGYTEWGRVTKFLESLGSAEPAAWNGEEALSTVEKAMEGAMLLEVRRLERFLSLLATTGNTAPFIGLFGTVWGIMTSFHHIGLKGAANLAVVAPGISEALVATAIGLFAAIPAVIFFNYFMNRIQAIQGQMQYFAGDLYTVLKREWMRRSAAQAKEVVEESPAVVRTSR